MNSSTCRTLMTLVLASSSVAARADVLNVLGNYSGTINGQAMAGTAAGVLDTSGDGANHIQIDFSSYPAGSHPYAYGVSKTTIICWGGNKALEGAANLFDLSGGNYTVDRTFTWPSLPGSQVIATGAVGTVGNNMQFNVAMNGMYAGPTDLVSVLSYKVQWNQLTPSSIQEAGVGEILRSDGSVLTVHVSSVYAGLASPMPFATQYGEMTRRDLTWNGSTYTLDWNGYLVPAPSSLLALASFAGLAGRRRGR